MVTVNGSFTMSDHANPWLGAIESASNSPDSPGSVRLRVKAVPGASRSKIAGMLGDRVKIAVAAAPEDGKANEALCELLAKTLGLPRRNITVVHGHTQPRKTLLIQGVSEEALIAALARA
jgi:uncharacterized protein (TIGR00251 family)